MKPFSAVLAGFSVIIFLSGKPSHQFSAMRSYNEVESVHSKLMRDNHAVLQKDSNRCDGSVGAGNPCVKEGNTCYCFVTKQQPWLKAYDFCRANGMSLLSIESLEKQQEIKKVLPQFTAGFQLVNQIGLWTSGTYISAMNTFVWAGRFTLFSFANWLYGAPVLTAPTECVRAIPTLDYIWADLSCEQWLPSVCESTGGSGSSSGNSGSSNPGKGRSAPSSDVVTVENAQTGETVVIPVDPDDSVEVEVATDSPVVQVVVPVN